MTPSLSFLSSAAAQTATGIFGWAQKLVTDLNSTPVSSIATGSRVFWDTATPTPAPPAGWLLEDGRSLTVADQSALFAVIGYTYGGAGANFNLRDSRVNAMNIPLIIKT